MKKSELVQHIKEEYERTGDVLRKLKVISDDDIKLENYHITDRFRDALMFLNNGSYDELRKLLERAANQKWL